MVSVIKVLDQLPMSFLGSLGSTANFMIWFLVKRDSSHSCLNFKTVLEFFWRTRKTWSWTIWALFWTIKLTDSLQFLKFFHYKNFSKRKERVWPILSESGRCWVKVADVWGKAADVRTFCVYYFSDVKGLTADVSNTIELIFTLKSRVESGQCWWSQGLWLRTRVRGKS